MCVLKESVCGGVEENESNGAQKRPVMHRGGGDGGASKCLRSALQHITHTHTHKAYSLCVTKKVKCVFIQQHQASHQEHYGYAIVLFTCV